jgi:thiol:disulfide interchange protein
VKRSALFVGVLLAAVALSQSAFAQAPSTMSSPNKLNWLPWSDEVFTQAKHEQRFVLLDLEAVWCHWCHVMDVTTYRDPKVLALLHSKYLTVRVDQDSRPDLSDRYEDYGWPATVVFDGGGHEIVKRQGYLTPDEMAGMLQAIIDDPSPGPSVQAEREIMFPRESAAGKCAESAAGEGLSRGIRCEAGQLGD